ncbi:13701_t:CDS:2, partial [Funneliformis geosporum]
MESEKKATYIYLVTIAYDGSNFAGWAKQPEEFTVQGYIENILSRVLAQKINILATSRTDKGVHAREQKFTLRLNFFLTSSKLKLILAKSLREYLTIKSVQRVKASFHPLRAVIKKEYHTKKLLNILTIFCGKHDFFNFAYCRQKDRPKIST